MLHAGIVGVVHVVLDRVEARFAGTGRGLLERAAGRGIGLVGGVGHVVAGRVAAALEGVIEPGPMADLMHRGHAEIVRPGLAGPGRSASGKLAWWMHDAVELGRVGIPPREGGVAQQSAAGLGGIEIERAGGVLAELGLHLDLGVGAGLVVEPGIVLMQVHVDDLEFDRGGRVGAVQQRDLRLELPIGQVALCALVDDVEADRDHRAAAEVDAVRPERGDHAVRLDLLARGGRRRAAAIELARGRSDLRATADRFWRWRWPGRRRRTT